MSEARGGVVVRADFIDFVIVFVLLIILCSIIKLLLLLIKDLVSLDKGCTIEAVVTEGKRKVIVFKEVLSQLHKDLSRGCRGNDL